MNEEGVKQPRGPSGQRTSASLAATRPVLELDDRLVMDDERVVADRVPQARP